MPLRKLMTTCGRWARIIRARLAGRVDRAGYEGARAVEVGVVALLHQPVRTERRDIDAALVGLGEPGARFAQKAHAQVDPPRIAAVEQMDGDPLGPAAVEGGQQQHDARALVHASSKPSISVIARAAERGF